MPDYGNAPARLDMAQREQVPQALARLVVVCLFICLWFVLWLARIPMPVPFLAVLVLEALFFVFYWRAVFLLSAESHVRIAHYCMLAAEILFHTTMVYFLGGITWLGAFAYVFGLIFTNAFLDLRRGFIYTSGAASAFAALALLDATGTIPHYMYLDHNVSRYRDFRVVATTLLGGTGVFYSIYLWVNWVGHQLRYERDNAVAMSDQLVRARVDLERANAELEMRVSERTQELGLANDALTASERLLRSTIESTADGILVVDREGKVLHANGRFAEMWRIPRKLLETRDDDRLLSFVLDQLSDPEAFLAKVRELYQSSNESLDSLYFKDSRVFERYSRPLMGDDDIAGRVWSFRDITEQKRAEEALRDSEKNFRLLFADNPHPMWVFERQARAFIEVNEAAITHYGYSREEFLRMTINDIRPEEDIPLLDSARKRRERYSEGAFRHRVRDGRIIDVYVRAHDLEFAGEDAVLVVVQDITEQKRAEQTQARLTAIVEATTDLVTIADASGQRLYLNHAGRRMLGIGDGDLAGSTMADNRPAWSRVALLDEVLPAATRDDVWVGESAFLSPDGSEIPVSQVTLSHKSPNGAVDFYSIIARDISERKQFETQLMHLANHDPLTGLFNRRRFNEEVERHLSEAQRYDTHGALLFLDLDQFKDVNDSRGHRTGDELLICIGRLLRERLRETDVIARFGGDEFAVLFPHTDGEQARALAAEILSAIREHTCISGSPLRITASIGVALYPEHSTNAGELLSRADLAMYNAKEEGRNRISVFAPGADWQARIESRIGWQQRIRKALEDNLFVLYAQPILNLAHGEVTQYELLLRMVEPDGELVLPGAFLDIAERSGLIQDIDRWVVRRAIRLLAEHEQMGRSRRLEVNLSGKAFSDPELLPMIQRELLETRIDPSNLVLEVTETVAIANVDEAQRFVRTLKGMGCAFALDDFGVGFSSFSHLKHLPVDYLKIDGSFIRELARNTVDQHLVQAIVAVARGLGKRTIAEFVGDERSLVLLKEYGVDYAQGFYIGHPAPLPLAPRKDQAA